MNPTSPGRCWAVGVGPGDPELLTLKSVSLLRQAETIVHAGPTADRGRALDIVRALLRPAQEVRSLLATGMSDIGRDDYRPGVAQIAADCRHGRRVVFIAEGDPTLYSTAAHVCSLLAELHPDVPVEIVPGVTSVTAAAARAGWPLAQKDEPLLIVPAGYHPAQLQAWLAAFPSVCLLKPGQALPELARTLGPQQRAVYVEEVGTEREWLTTDLASAAARQHYFALVLVRSSGTQPARSASEGGQITLVGLGPGDLALLTPQARQALHAAEVIIGYDAYLQRLTPLGLTAELQPFPLGAEAERARRALELAAAGWRVALVSSGDAGVYGMASLLLETAATSPHVDIAIVPGVTAATAAAALLGAPLGHDFACISLSDLLTPWAVIERRLEAAAQGDFVVALYNPVSQRRTWQLPKARDILLSQRRPETPVGLVDRAHRSGQRVWHTKLGALATDGIGMETILIVGNSQTRLVNGRMVTPRGYPASGGRQPPAPSAATPGAATGDLRPPLAPSIMEQSFAIIESEFGAHDLPPWAFAVARRMIHASADFEFARTLRYSPDFADAVQQALRAGAVILSDTEMVRVGLRTAVAKLPQVTLACHLNDAAVRPLAEAAGLTRSAAGLRVAAQRYPAPIVVIGNAPTALDEALRLVAEGWRPTAIVGLPVGFVGVEEAKGRLLSQTLVPYLTCVGRKGGSAVAAAAVNALTENFKDGRE